VGTYAGIGSRETPHDIQYVMYRIAQKLAAKGWVLRSGGADGADKAFEQGCDKVSGEKEIYLPWKGFNSNKSPLYDISEEAFEMASKHHPSWGNCSQGGKRLHARNCYQVLGKDLKTPVSFILCYTVGGSGKGGTGQAIRIAKKHNIPIFDFGKYLDTQNAKNEAILFLKQFVSRKKLDAD